MKWYMNRSFELANSDLPTASDYLHKYLTLWYGGNWTVMYYYDHAVKYFTKYRPPNLCNEVVKQNFDKNLKVLMFEHFPNELPKVNTSCDCWSKMLEIKILRFSTNLHNATKELHRDLQMENPNTPFTVTCVSDMHYGMKHTSENSCRYFRNDNATTCYIYQH